MLIVIAVILIILAISFFLWTMKHMTEDVCPVCYEDDVEEMVLPVVPGYRWWCPTCNNFFATSELVQNKEDKSEEY